MEDAARIERLVADIDKDPDPLHGDSTPAVRALAGLGVAVIPFLRQPLAAPSMATRLRAQAVLAETVARHFGFVPGSGWSRVDGEEASHALWVRNGSYDAVAPESQRSASIEAWMAWCARGTDGSVP